MRDRRAFLKTVGAAAGSAAVADLATARELVADELRHVPRGVGVDRFASLRDRYLLDPGILYVNHASIGTIPRLVHDARVRYLELCETNPWAYMWGNEREEPREDVRAKAGSMLGCLPEDVALYNEYHALLVCLGKDYCRKSEPKCETCPLADMLPEGGPLEPEC